MKKHTANQKYVNERADCLGLRDGILDEMFLTQELPFLPQTMQQNVAHEENVVAAGVDDQRGQLVVHRLEQVAQRNVVVANFTPERFSWWWTIDDGCDLDSGEELPVASIHVDTNHDQEYILVGPCQCY